MADLRNTISSALTPMARPATTPARSDAVRAAQRAFFDAAMNQTPAAAPATAVRQTAPVARAAAVSPSRAVAVATTPARVDVQTPPTRLLRPGSLLDITV